MYNFYFATKRISRWDEWTILIVITLNKSCLFTYEIFYYLIREPLHTGKFIEEFPSTTTWGVLYVYLYPSPGRAVGSPPSSCSSKSLRNHLNLQNTWCIIDTPVNIIIIAWWWWWDQWHPLLFWMEKSHLIQLRLDYEYYYVINPGIIYIYF